MIPTLVPEHQGFSAGCYGGRAEEERIEREKSVFILKYAYARGTAMPGHPTSNTGQPSLPSQQCFLAKFNCYLIAAQIGTSKTMIKKHKQKGKHHSGSGELHTIARGGFQVFRQGSKAF